MDVTSVNNNDVNLRTREEEGGNAQTCPQQPEILGFAREFLVD